MTVPVAHLSLPASNQGRESPVGYREGLLRTPTENSLNQGVALDTFMMSDKDLAL